jgi:hypothetical protein
MQDFDMEKFMKALEPIYSQVWVFSMILAFFVLSFWLMRKFSIMADPKNEGKETIKGIVGKLIIFCFIIFNWPHIFKSMFLFGDATESRIHQIDISQSIPPEIREKIGRQEMEMDNVINMMYDKATLSIYNVKAGLTKKERDQLEKEAAEALRISQIDNILKRSIVKAASKTKQYVGKTAQRAKSAVAEPFKMFGGGIAQMIIFFTASVTKKSMLMVRIIFSGFYLVVVPCAFVFSYMPVLSKEEDEKGMTEWSRKTISWMFNMSLWPTYYALLDKILLITYYQLHGMGVFKEFGNNTSFFIGYIVLYITLPFMIQKANPYALMQGMMSAISSTAMIAGMMGSQALGKMKMPKIGGGGSASSNAEAAGGE